VIFWGARRLIGSKKKGGFKLRKKEEKDLFSERSVNYSREKKRLLPSMGGGEDGDGALGEGGERGLYAKGGGEISRESGDPSPLKTPTTQLNKGGVSPGKGGGFNNKLSRA